MGGPLSSTDSWEPLFGAFCSRGGVEFRVWAPAASLVELVVEAPVKCSIALQQHCDGVWRRFVAGLGPGTLYWYRLDGEGPYPDPASRFQPHGVHGPSEVIDASNFAWTDQHWRGVELERLVIYELHIGTFTQAGTFQAAHEKLRYLKELGVTAIELMPVADFAGDRNWGYDAAAWYAPARCYGRPDDLRALVNHAHELGLAVLLDVVYNHLGPDGAYLARFSPQALSQKYRTPWGPAINLDGPGSTMMRRFICDNALYWVHEFHIDGFRFDSTHAFYDQTRPHFLQELTLALRHASQQLGRRLLLIAEDHRNLRELVAPVGEHGFGFDAVWSEDFHHSMRRLLARDADGYFQDFNGTAEEIATVLNQGWLFTGQQSQYYGGPRGTSIEGTRPPQFVIYLQNHDQVGHRPFGRRLHHEVDLASWRAASTLLILAPETPLLFMGQEWAASSPFHFFIDHRPELARKIWEGRRCELSRFHAFADPKIWSRLPDPGSLETFRACKLRWDELEEEPHKGILALYKRLLKLRATHPALTVPEREFAIAEAYDAETLLLRREGPNARALLAVIRLRHGGLVQLTRTALWAGRSWTLLLDTEAEPFADPPAPSRIDWTHGCIEFKRAGAVILELTWAESPEVVQHSRRPKIGKPNEPSNDSTLGMHPDKKVRAARTLTRRE